MSYRLSHALSRRGWKLPAHAVATLAHVLTGAEIRPAAQLGPGFVVVHPTGVVIGGGVVAGAGLSLWGSNTLGYTEFGDPSRPGGSPHLGDGVVVLSHASIFGPVRVGDRVLVGAYSLVLDDVSDGSRVRGIPARA